MKDFRQRHPQDPILASQVPCSRKGLLFSFNKETNRENGHKGNYSKTHNTLGHT